MKSENMIPVPAAELEQMLRPTHVTFEPNKMYSYVWPGSDRKEIKGSDLTELCKGADVSMLDIQEVDGAKVEAPKKPSVSITGVSVLSDPSKESK